MNEKRCDEVKIVCDTLFLASILCERAGEMVFDVSILDVVIIYIYPLIILDIRDGSKVRRRSTTSIPLNYR
jgi:hypothetical protein